MWRTSATKLALLGGFVVVALLAALVRQDYGSASRLQLASAHGPEAGSSRIVTLTHVVDPAPAEVAPPTPLQSERADMRASEAQLHAKAAEESYVRVGGVFVEHLVARGLARSDAERVVRRFFDASIACLFDALGFEAGAQSVDYASVLDAIDANLHDTDGPLLEGLIDMAAVSQRVEPCSLTVAQQAGLEPAVFAEAARAVFRRAP